MKYSIVYKNNLDKIASRIDAEYYKPECLLLEKKISKLNTTNLQKVDGKLDCSAFYPSIVQYYTSKKEGRIPFLRVNEIQGGLLSISNETVFLPEKVLDDNRSTIARCKPGDIIIAKGGNSLAKVALLTDRYDSYSICRDLIVLKTGDLSILNKYSLWVFLHSSIGKKSLLRTASQTGQPHLTVNAIYGIDIPVFKGTFQEYIEKTYYTLRTYDKESNEMYWKAYNLLSSEFDLFKLESKAKQVLTYTKSFSDAIKCNRVDAEYFQPKYEELIEFVENYSNGNDEFENVVNIKDKNVKPNTGQCYKYIELANVGDTGEVNGCTEDKGENLPGRARRKVRTGDIIISSVQGSLTSIALIDNNFDKSLCSNGFFVINSEKINPETLLVLLKSHIGQEQLNRGCSGTILPSINKPELEKIVIPLIDPKVQKDIKSKINRSFSLKHKSNKLIDYLSKSVEIAINQSDDEALDWLNKKVDSLKE